MKNYFTYIFIGLIASIFISSCSSNYSITKRRYNKGYYVQHSPKKVAEPKSTDKKELAKQDVPENIYVLPSAIENQQTVKKTEVETPATAQSPKTHQQTKVAKAIKNVLPAEFSVKNQIRSIKELAQRASADKGDDALSLIWIVIVVILILYILGLALDLAGGSGLIHLLAVVALILLILWLLKII